MLKVLQNVYIARLCKIAYAVRYDFDSASMSRTNLVSRPFFAEEEKRTLLAHAHELLRF